MGYFNLQKGLVIGIAFSALLLLSSNAYAQNTFKHDRLFIVQDNPGKLALIFDDEILTLDVSSLVNDDGDSLTVDRGAFHSALMDKASRSNREAKEPVLIINEQDHTKYDIETGQDGWTLDIGETIKLFNRWIVESDKSRNIVDYKIVPVIERSYPEKNVGYYNYLRENVTASFSTEFSLYDKNRVENLRVSTRTVNDYVIMPGEIFSLGQTLGPRTYSKGYKDAGIFVNGKKSTGIAGGICQTSSTLFNALMYADMDLVERHRHSLPVPYLERGRDAAISSRQDLKVRNPFDDPVRITTWIDDENGELFVEIYGKDKKRIELVTRKSHEGGRNVYRTFKQYLDEAGDAAEDVLILKDVI